MNAVICLPSGLVLVRIKIHLPHTLEAGAVGVCPQTASETYSSAVDTGSGFFCVFIQQLCKFSNEFELCHENGEVSVTQNSFLHLPASRACKHTTENKICALKDEVLNVTWKTEFICLHSTTQMKLI